MKAKLSLQKDSSAAGMPLVSLPLGPGLCIHQKSFFARMIKNSGRHTQMLMQAWRPPAIGQLCTVVFI